jgi:rubrerythrin
MSAMTRENLQAAFAGESQAHVKYLAFAQKAERENKPHIANLFRAVAHAELVHAINHLRELGKIGTTADNLEAAKAGEDYEVDEMYAAFLAVADLQEDKGAIKTMTYAQEAEKIHSDLYAAASAAVEAGEDIAEATVWICPVCGFTVLGDDVPERCPVCKALRKVFEEFSV